MSLLYRYLMRALLRGFLLVTGALLALFGLFEFMERADDVGDASYSLADALLVTLMIMPARLADLSPFIALIGAVYGLGTFVRSHELIAMRAAGVTPLRLAGITATASLLFLLGFGLVELAARPLSQQANLFYMAETSRDGTLFSESGIWVQHGAVYVHIDSLERGGGPSGIHIYEFGSDDALDVYTEADGAVIDSVSSWQLRNLTEKRYPPAGDPQEQIVTLTETSRNWAPPWEQTTFLFEMPIESLSLRQLLAHMQLLQSEGASTGVYAMEFWRRCLMPVSGIIFTLFGAPFVLGVGPRSSMGGAVTLGLANALGIFLLQQIVSNGFYLATQSPVLAVSAPLVLVLIPALLLLRRVSGPPTG